MRNLLIPLFVLLGHYSLACSCIGDITVKEEIKHSNAVFVGKVLSQEQFYINENIDVLQIHSVIKHYYVKYTFQVEILYKNKLISDTVKIITGTGHGDCGFEFKVGEEYIVYAVSKNRLWAKGPEINSFLYTDICTRTKEKR